MFRSAEPAEVRQRAEQLADDLGLDDIAPIVEWAQRPTRGEGAVATPDRILGGEPTRAAVYLRLAPVGDLDQPRGTLRLVFLDPTG